MISNHLPTLLGEARRASVRLQRRLDLPHTDRCDLEQDLIVDLLRRLPAYDPARGGIGPFAGAVLRNRANRVAARALSARRRAGGSIASFYDGDRGALAELVADGEGLWPVTSFIDRSEDVMSLACVIGHLDADDRRLCSDLAAESVSDLVRAGRYSRSSLYRRIARLRLTFAAWGLSREVG